MASDGSAEGQAASDHASRFGWFSPAVQEKLGYYVYLLTDPRDGKIFYIGKGKDNRVFSHAEAALNDAQASDKLKRIRDIQRSGHRVSYELLRFGMSETAAFDVEAAAIQLLEGDDLKLHNIVAGHHVAERGRMSTDVAISLFDAPPVGMISEPSLLIKILLLWHPDMTPEELAEATCKWWVIGTRRQ